MRTLLQDLRYGGRILRQQPAFSAIIIVTLGLAIGANSVIFSVANGLIMRPLPFRNAERLAWIRMVDVQQRGRRSALTVPELTDFRESLQSVDAIGAFSPATYTLTGAGDAERLSAERVTANLLDIWGVRAVAGRAFVAGDDRPGAPDAVVLSHQLWQRRFGGDAAIIGRPITLNGRPFVVVGVLNDALEIGTYQHVQLWTPLTLDPAAPRDRRDLRAVALMKPGATVEQVSAEARDTAQRLANAHPRTNAGLSARAMSTAQVLVSENTWPVLALLGVVVGFVLLIACANIANLVLARGTTRQREMAMRAALGASRGRLVRQVITEGLTFGIAGGVLGLAIAWIGLQGIRAASYEQFFQSLGLEWNVMAFTAVLAIAAPVFFSILPALQSSRPDVSETLKEAAVRTGGGIRGRRSRSVLVVSQIAIALTLLIVSTFLVRSMIAYGRAPLGFDAPHMLTVQTDLPEWRYTSDDAVRAFYARLMSRLGALPGVTGVAIVDRLPVLGPETPRTVEIDGHAAARPEDRAWTVPVIASPGFFAAAGIPLLEGRELHPSDDDGAARVAVVNREMAQRYWGSTTAALDRRLSIAAGPGEPVSYTIVGVVENTMRADLSGANPQIYLSALQHPQRAMAVVVRSDRAAELKAAVRDELRAADRDVPVSELQTIAEGFEREISSNRIVTGLFGSFAVLALVLAAAGLYGVISCSVSQRVREIGVRMALGALPADVRRLIVGQTLVLLAIGTALGLAGGAILMRLSSSVLYGVSPTDTVTYASVSGVLALVALLAAYGPVRRATRIDPLRALRTE
ncbi:MAG TPA: ABC transporter permease [Vicinamibacterales bacterium]|nr:ABC transporter permease [Vicinamibacterales bacterium]